MLYKNTIKLSLDDEYADYMLTTADKLISENNFYLLKCNFCDQDRKSTVDFLRVFRVS